MPAVFTGMLQGEELSQAYASGDIFIMPSESETLGLVVLEAMSSGHYLHSYFSRNFATETAAVEDKVKALSCSPPPEEKRYKLYVSNLAWKVRGKDLREFFAANNPASVKVVFNESTRNSAGYGFISFLTREEAETAISDLNGKELSGRPITLRFSKKSLDEVASTEENTPEA